MDTRRQNRRGINHVEKVVCTQWSCGWQEYSSANDDGVDGLILMRRGSEPARDTGGVVFAQVKCGRSYVSTQNQHPESLCVSLGSKYLHSHLPRWRRLPGPSVLIFVDDPDAREEPSSWWVNLRSDCISPTNDGILLIPLVQRFAHHTKGAFQKLCGASPVDKALRDVQLHTEDLMPMILGRSLRHDAWEFYKAWRSERSVHAEIGPILVNRVGWKHVNRITRNPNRIVNSWMLLPAARKIILDGVPPTYLGNSSTQTTEFGTNITDYLGLRACSFPTVIRALSK